MNLRSISPALLTLIIFNCPFANRAWEKTAGEMLAPLQGLQGSAREAQLIAGAKKEGQMVRYGTTNIAVMQQLSDRFKKKYSFLQVDNYRAITNRVYTKIQAEARSGNHGVEVVEISPDSAFKLFGPRYADYVRWYYDIFRHC